jgi:hypothetical protein
MKQNYLMILVFSTLLIVNTGAFAAEKGVLGTRVEPGSEELKSNQGLTVMITVFNGERPVAQREKSISAYTSFNNLPSGTYRIRYESPGLQTIEKQGILVFPNKTTDSHSSLNVSFAKGEFVFPSGHAER